MARTCVYDSCFAGVVNTVLDIAAYQEIDGLFNHIQCQHEPLSWFYLAAKSIFQSDVKLCVSEEDVKQLVELGSTRTPSERIQHECENLLRQGSIATTIHREITEQVPLQIQRGWISTTSNAES